MIVFLIPLLSFSNQRVGNQSLTQIHVNELTSRGTAKDQAHTRARKCTSTQMHKFTNAQTGVPYCLSALYLACCY